MLLCILFFMAGWAVLANAKPTHIDVHTHDEVFLEDKGSMQMHETLDNRKKRASNPFQE